MRRVFAVVLVVIMLSALQVATPASACVCGGIVPPPRAKIEPAGARAIVNWTGKQESVTMMLNLATNSKETGFVVPTPTPAVVTRGDRKLFDLLERTIAPQTYTTDDWWGTSVFEHHDPPKGVTILRRVSLGTMQATSLASTDSLALTAWLADNGYLISPAMTADLANYTTLGWSFTAIKLGSNQSLGGTLDPITLTFPAEHLIYPMALSGLTTTPQDLRMYILDAQRDGVVQASRPTVDVGGKVTLRWAGSVRNPELWKFGKYLSVIDIAFDKPHQQIKDDIGILLSADATDFYPRTQKFRVITLLGVPVGTLTVTWSLLGLGLIISYFVRRRRYS